MGGYDEEASRRRHRLADLDSLFWPFAVRCHLSAAGSQARFRAPIDAPVSRFGRDLQRWLAYRELDDALGLSAMAGEELADARNRQEWPACSCRDVVAIRLRSACRI